MSHNVEAIGNHSLDTSSVETLAIELGQKLKINVDFGYFGWIQYFNLLGIDRNEDDRVELGKYFCATNAPTFWLEDEHYQLKQLYRKYGEELFRLPQYWFFYDKVPAEDNPVVVSEKLNLKFPCYVAYSKENYSNFLTIAKDLYINDLIDFGDWFNFVDTFMRFDYYHYMGYDADIHTIRNQLMHTTFALGGNKMYYVDDNSDVLDGIGIGEELNMTWCEVEDKIMQKAGHRTLDVPAFLTNTEYRKQYLKNNIEPLCFFDDFRDLIHRP
jgi:hypothetical protein